MIMMKKGEFRENIKLSLCFVLARFYSVRLSLIKVGSSIKTLFYQVMQFRTNIISAKGLKALTN